jgi:hypothetical protein
MSKRYNHSLKLMESTACYSPRDNDITMTTYITGTRELTATIILRVTAAPKGIPSGLAPVR